MLSQRAKTGYWYIEHVSFNAITIFFLIGRKILSEPIIPEGHSNHLFTVETGKNYVGAE